MYPRLHKNDSSNNQKIPAWSAFQEFSTQVLPNQVNVGYLSPITDSPTEMKVIYAAIYVFTHHEWVRYKIHIFGSRSSNLNKGS